MAASAKVLGALLFFAAAVAVQACTPECKGCNPNGIYWNGQGCGKGSNRVFSRTLPDGSDHTACCAACAKDKCCLFWVYKPDSQNCDGFANCNRIDNQPTVREWLGDWKVLPKSCPGYSENPDAEVGYPGLHNPKDKPWPVGNNRYVSGN